jgi:hypothetical protein
MQYHYEKNGNRIGPVEKEEIQKLIDNNILDRDSKIWCKEFADWMSINETDFDISQLPPPPLTGSSLNNTYIWILAFAPIIGLILEYTLAYATSSSDYVAENNVDNGKYWIVTMVLNVLLCWLDEKQLSKSGHDTSKFKGLLWLVPVYLYIRCKKTKVQFAPFIIWIVMFILSLF